MPKKKRNVREQYATPSNGTSDSVSMWPQKRFKTTNSDTIHPVKIKTLQEIMMEKKEKEKNLSNVTVVLEKGWRFYIFFF